MRIVRLFQNDPKEPGREQQKVTGVQMISVLDE